jgi:hypothetical protein
VDRLVAATAGMTASFFSELARRATLLAAVAGEHHPTVEHVETALAELRASREALAAPPDERLAGPRRPVPSGPGNPDADSASGRQTGARAADAACLGRMAAG